MEFLYTDQLPASADATALAEVGRQLQVDALIAASRTKAQRAMADSAVVEQRVKGALSKSVRRKLRCVELLCDRSTLICLCV